MSRLGKDILELCPTIKDREDEEEIQQNFCFVLADEQERDGIISYHAKRLLNLSECVLPLFSTPDSTACLMLHTVRQEHRVLEGSNTEATGDKDESTKAASSELREERVEGEGERELTGTVAEGKAIWRQQETVIIYDGYTEEADFEEDEEITTVEMEYPGPDAPSKQIANSFCLISIWSLVPMVPAIKSPLKSEQLHFAMMWLNRHWGWLLTRPTSIEL